MQGMRDNNVKFLSGLRGSSPQPLPICQPKDLQFFTRGCPPASSTTTIFCSYNDNDNSPHDKSELYPDYIDSSGQETKVLKDSGIAFCHLDFYDVVSRNLVTLLCIQ